MSDTFLTREEIAALTGRKFKSLQIAQLRRMPVPFWIDAKGKPVVARSSIEGKKPAPSPIKEKWVSNALKEK